MAARAKKGEPGFEESLEKLENIVDQLEDSSLPLEESLKAFEEGMATYRHCVGVLDKARNRVETLLKRGEELVSQTMPADISEPDEE